MFSEPFQLLIAPGENHWTDDGFDSEVASRIRSAADELVDQREEADFEDAAVGRGADTLAILITIAGVLLAGKKVEESFDAWMRMLHRLKAALRKLRDISPAVYISEPAAALIAFEIVAGESLSDRAVTLTSSALLLVDPAGVPEEFRRSLASLAERYYLFQFRDGRGDTHVVCVRSTGDVELHHVLKTGSWLGFHGFE